MKSPTQVASISVIIPAFNAEQMLPRCLQGLATGTLAPLEVIVVDDVSTDSTATVATALGASVIRARTRRGPAVARNLGGRAARGDILVFLDADVEVHPDTLQRLALALQADPELTAIMGSYDDAPADPGIVSRYRNLLHSHTHQTGRLESSSFWAGCGAIRREIFLEAGGFDESFPRPSIEDVELGWRLHRAGRRLALDPAIQVRHLKRWTLPLMLRTDLWARAVPWTHLLLRTGGIPDDLILRHSHRLSVILAWLLPAALVAAATGRAGAVAPLLLVLGAYTWLNRGFFVFLLSRGGIAMALAAWPLHLLFHFTAGLGFAIGAAAHYLGWTTQGSAALPRKADE